MGETGLGLPIVEMIAEIKNCDVAFIDQGDDWSNYYELSWRVER